MEKDTLDNQLRLELNKTDPNEKTIRSLVEQGANINAIDSGGDSLLMDVVSAVKYGLDIKFVQLLIDLGADVNHEDEGFNCLFEAWFTFRPDLFELLLKAGANPNCVSSSSPESLLDWTESDLYYEEREGRYDTDPMFEMVELLKKYGAKPMSEIYVHKPEKFLRVCSGYPDGLRTLHGYIRIEDIPHVSNNTITLWNQWLAEDPTKKKQYESWDSRINSADFQLLKIHTEKGLQLSKELRKLVDKEIEVTYYCTKLDNHKRLSGEWLKVE